MKPLFTVTWQSYDSSAPFSGFDLSDLWEHETKEADWLASRQSQDERCTVTPRS